MTEEIEKTTKYVDINIGYHYMQKQQSKTTIATNKKHSNQKCSRQMNPTSKLCKKMTKQTINCYKVENIKTSINSNNGNT
jgi:anti-sigma28 factor (negative regulator of flagellin synthesis)